MNENEEPAEKNSRSEEEQAAAPSKEPRGLFETDKPLRSPIESEIDTQLQKPLNLSGLVPPEKKTPQKVSKIAIFISAVVCLIGGAVGGYFWGSHDSRITDPELIKIIQAYEVLRDNWFYGKTTDDVTDVVTDLMLNGLNSEDPYTFYTPDSEDQNLSTTSKSLGAETFACPEGRYLVHVHTKSPLYKANGGAGARPGDILIKVRIGEEEHSFAGLDEEAASALLERAKGGEADYILKRGQETFELSGLKPQKFEEDVAWLLLDETVEEKRALAIRIDTFLGDPFAEVSRILAEKSEAEKIDRLVFDLRDNGGGYVDQAYKLACLFAPRGSDIIYTKDRYGNTIDHYVQLKDPLYEVPDIRVITNSRSASASESFALSLMQNNAAKIYGHRSFGKGIAQTFLTFKDGSMMRYTFGKVFGPDGTTSIHQVGIKPDVLSAHPELPYPYVLNLTAENYAQNALYIENLLDYLNIAGETLAERIESFQAAYNYEKEEYSLETSRQLTYESYRRSLEESSAELSEALRGA